MPLILPSARGSIGRWERCSPIAFARRLIRNKVSQDAIEAGLVVHCAHPLNAETSVPALMGGVVMPNGRFYIRNHFQIPNLNAAHYRRPLSACGGWFGTAQAQSQPSGSDADAVANFFRHTRMRR